MLSAAAESAAGSARAFRWQRAVEWAAALALAALWFSAGLWKLSDVTGWQLKLTQLLVPKSLSLAGALSFGTAETFAGVLLLLPQWRRWGSWLSVFLLSAFMAYIGVHYHALTGADCSCFPWLKRAIGPMFFVEDAALLALAVLAGLWSSPPRAPRRAAVVLVAVLALAAGLYASGRNRGEGAPGPATITADGKPFSLHEGRVLLFFFNPYCPHCFQAAQNMARFNWQASIVALPTQAPEQSPGFFQSAGMAGVHLSADTDQLRQ
ncbi:MAG TPA: MauE/DoxX family redox-associated membrane protein, partial [Bryobacterales bacterium]|nr:MauE/DoxX family redox-associated membrane protein [Bryobacterales bacterium]